MENTDPQADDTLRTATATTWDTDEMAAWYEKAKSLLKAKDVSLAELGEILGVSASAAGHYLNGRRSPKPGMLRKIAKAAGVSVSELIEDDPSFARDQYEHSVLEALRDIPEDQKQAALAMLRGLGQKRTERSEAAD